MTAKQVSILLVEDSRLQRELIRAALHRMGYQVEAVETGEEALARFAVGKFDVLLVDILLPSISGAEVLSQVHKLDVDQCIILMTAVGSGLSAMGAIRAGADDYVTKPIRMDDEGAELEVIISRSLERRRLARENRDLQERLVEAQRLNAIMALAGAAAHEMNQPLTVLTGTVEMLLMDGDPGPTYQEELKKVRRATQRLTQIVAQLSTITSYRTKPYAYGTAILDLDRSAQENHG